MKIKKCLAMILNLFDGSAGGGEGGAAAPAASDAGTQGDTTAEALLEAASRGKSGDPYANVLFGKQQEPDADPGKAVTTGNQDGSHAAGEGKDMDTLRKEFRDMIKGPYKDVYTETTQKMFNRRFSDHKQLESRVAESQPVLDMLMQRYNIKDGDMQALTAAIESDDAYWADAAADAGMDVDQYREFQRLQRENQRFHQEQQSRQQRARVEQQTSQWLEEAKQLKERFPDFDFATEIQNPDFAAMLKAGTPVEHAYKAMHFDELMDSTINSTRANTEKRVADSVRANGSRPSENGASKNAAFTVKDDPSKYTKEDFEEIVRRVAAGEIISM